jgi:glycosyltransferase involved in cell wall biosynthesis
METIRKSVTPASRCPTLNDLPPPPEGKTGWPWTEQSKPLPDTTADGQLWPKISIVTPSYNQGGFIEEAIRSVLLQGYPDLEYIIIDGGSTDETIDVIKKYEPWLAYWESEPDRGQSHAINKGLLKSTGKLFNWHNSDDVLMPNAIGIVAKVMVEHPEASYVYGDRIYIDEMGVCRAGSKETGGSKTCFFPEVTTAFSTLHGGSQPGCLMDKELVTKVGGIDESVHYIMDVDMLLRLALVKPFVHITEPVSYVRAYPGIKSSQWTNQRAKERIHVARKLFAYRDVPDPVRKVRRQSFAAAHQFAWRCYAKAKNYRFFLWHFVLDVFYAGGRGWKKRLKMLFGLHKEWL